MKKHDLITCFRTFATLAIIGAFLILTNDFAHSSLSVSSPRANSSSDVENIVYVSGTEERVQLFTYKGDPTTQFIENDDATKKYPIIINRDIIGLTNGQEFSIIFPEQVYATIVHEKTLPHPGNSLTMIGFLKEFGQLFRVTITFHNDAIRGKITTPDGVIRLISTPDGDFLIDQRDSYRTPGLLDDDMLLPPDPESNIINYPPIKMASSGNTTIDLMIVYTSGFANNYPGDQLAARINELIAITNTVYADSGVNISLNLVHAALVTYSDTVSNSTALYDITDGVAGFSGIAVLRSQYGADLVSLIRPYSSSHSGGCGIAWINGFQGHDISLYADNGYSVILDGEYSVGSNTYFCTDLTLVHELGHNMGSAHDRAHSTEGSPGNPFDGAYSYSYGHGIDGVFGSIMSYISPEVAVFSNPDLTTCNGQVCGIDESLSNSANNALSLNNTREAIAGYVTSSTCPDFDADGICDASDACPADPDNDVDGDGICGDIDNCPTISNVNQTDIDNDGIGDACDQITDTDGDGIADSSDNCPDTSNASQADTDSDGVGDSCDACPIDPDNDVDRDGICGDIDNCPTISNADQTDIDNDGIGDACDQITDTDGDGIADSSDNCPDTSNASQADTDSDGVGDSCDTCPIDPDNDVDGDGICGDTDNCPTTSNTNQIDIDNDGIGDVCDAIAVPAPPTLSVSISDFVVSLSWTAATGATGYTLYYAPFPYEGEHTIKNKNMGDMTEFSTTLWPGASYYVAIAALNASGVSDYSNIELFTISTPPPAECGIDHLTLCTTDNDCSNAGGYWYANACNAIPEPAPESPVLFVSTSGLEVSLSWTPVAEATGYKLYYAPYLQGTEPVYVSADIGTAVEYSATLWPGAAYYVAVTSLGADNESEHSNVELIAMP